MGQRKVETPSGGIVYLASPYTKHPQGMDVAYENAVVAARRLLALGFCVYSPIIHGHPLPGEVGVVSGPLSRGNGSRLCGAKGMRIPLTSEFWWAHCKPFLDAAVLMVVLKDEGWNKSLGVIYEVGYMRAQGKRVWGMPLEGEVEDWELEIGHE
jgi:hypothetical protein